MMRFGFFIFIFIGQSVFGQSSSAVDSLRKIYLNETDGIKKAEAYFNLVKSLEDKNIELLPPAADTLESLSKENKYQKGIAQSMHLRAWYYSETGNRDSAALLYHRELSIYLTLHDSSGMAATYNNIGSNYRQAYQPDSAIPYLLKAVDLNLKLKQYKNVASGYANLGNLFSDQKLHEKGIEYLKKALAIRLEYGDEKGSPFTYNNIAVAFGTNGQLDSAFYYSKKGIDVALKFENYFVAGVIEGGLAHLYNEQNKYPEAIAFASKSLEYLQKVNRKANMVFPYINLATAYNRLNQPQKALEYAGQGYKIMKDLDLISPMEVYYEEMAKSYELLGHDKESLIWFKKFMQLDDSLFKSENTKNLADAEAKYQNQKKENELTSQRLNLAHQSNKILKQRIWITGMVIGLLFLVIFSILYFNRYRLKKQTELDAAVIQEQKQGLEAIIAAQEEERKRIAKDLHDGVAQELVALKLGFNLLELKINSKSTIHPEQVSTLSKQLDETTTEVRNIAHLMLPPTLEHQGLGPTLELLLANTLKNAGIDYKINIAGLSAGLNDKIEIGIYRIAQEIINNIIKHAHAKHVLFYLTLAGNILTLTVQDDGQGFNEQGIHQRSSMGLLNIVSRVATLGGTYKFENAEPHGTNSIVIIPIPHV
ncbi:MAG: sensor histidine kinase [Saprospiraceae bacterium]